MRIELIFAHLTLKPLIENIQLTCGAAEGREPLMLDGQPGLTILVGPTNCGKSAMLDAIHKALAVHAPAKPSALGGLTLTPFALENLDEHPSFKGRADAEDVVLNKSKMPRSQWVEIFQRNWTSQLSKNFRSGSTL